VLEAVARRGESAGAATGSLSLHERLTNAQQAVTALSVSFRHRERKSETDVPDVLDASLDTLLDFLVRASSHAQGAEAERLLSGRPSLCCSSVLHGDRLAA
jgi:hypothetical protein